jgi:membrane protease YdiL (CAAX protease family)
MSARRLIRDHPLAAYFLLACAISWAAVSPLVAAWFGLLPPIAPAWHWVGSLGPITAAVLVTFVIGGRDGLRELWSRMTRWRVGIAPWLLTFASTLGLCALAAVLLRIFGRPWPDLAPLRTSFADSGWVANLVAASLAYGIGEEPGWRGFALPRLQANRTALRATLILTLLWAFWHTPYFTYRYHIVGFSGYAGFFMCFIAGAIWLTFLYNTSQGSILLLILWHIMWNFVNVAGAAVADDLVGLINVLVIPLGIAALIVGGPRWLSWPRKQAAGPIRQPGAVPLRA